jgi:hypothetical protein
MKEREMVHRGENKGGKKEKKREKENPIIQKTISKDARRR